MEKAAYLLPFSSTPEDKSSQSGNGFSEGKVIMAVSSGCVKKRAVADPASAMILLSTRS